MSEKILVPVLGESITEATVHKWLKKKGDMVVADESIVELETDKVNLEVPAPLSGILSEVNSKDGDVVQVGAVLGTISESNKKIIENEITQNKTINNAQEANASQDKNNIINLKTEEKIESKDKEDPLVLTNELIETEKPMENKVLSPAVRKIAVE